MTMRRVRICDLFKTPGSLVRPSNEFPSHEGRMCGHEARVLRESPASVGKMNGGGCHWKCVNCGDMTPTHQHGDEPLCLDCIDYFRRNRELLRQRVGA